MNSTGNYNDFSVEDFVWDESFRQWVLSPAEDLNVFWHNWLLQNPNKRSLIQTAIEIIKETKIKEPEISDAEIFDIVNSVVDRLDKSGSGEKNGSRLIFTRWYYGIAATLIIAISVSVFFINRPVGHIPNNAAHVTDYKSLVNNSAEDLIERINNTSAPLVINLTDGSTVTLYKNSKISYSASFSRVEKRKVYLSGEAVFEVAKNKGKPFLVYANGLVTKVIGTKFKVRCYENEDKVTVDVSSGIVAVASMKDKNLKETIEDNKGGNIILTRNQKVNYTSSSNNLETLVVDEPVLINVEEADYKFKETPVETVFKMIEDGYGITVIFDREMLSKHKITANLKNKTMYQKLDAICKALDVHYEISDGKVIIYNK